MFQVGAGKGQWGVVVFPPFSELTVCEYILSNLYLLGSLKIQGRARVLAQLAVPA